MTKDMFVPPVGVVIWTFDGEGVMSVTQSQLTTSSKERESSTRREGPLPRDELSEPWKLYTAKDGREMDKIAFKYEDNSLRWDRRWRFKLARAGSS